MTNNTTNGPEDSAPAAAPARRLGGLGGRLAAGAGAGRSTVLGRGLDALLGNLRTAPRPHEDQPDPQPEEDLSKKYQTQSQRALLTRLETTAPAASMAAASPAPTPVVTQTRSDIGRGFIHLIQAGAPAVAAYVPTTGGENDENRVIRIEAKQLKPNPYHGDARHDPDSLRGLAQAVREQGLWQPLVVISAPATPGVRFRGTGSSPASGSIWQRSWWASATCRCWCAR